MYINVTLQTYISLFSSSRALLALPERGQLWRFCLNRPYLAEDPVLSWKLKDTSLHCRGKIMTRIPSTKGKARRWEQQARPGMELGPPAGVGRTGGWRCGCPSDPVVNIQTLPRCPSRWVASRGSVVKPVWGLKRQLMSSFGDAAGAWFLGAQTYRHQ